MENNRFNIKKTVFASICIVINIVGAFLALAFRLPIYLDTIGTIFGAVVMGPFYGVLIGLITGLINGISFDPVSLYYIPNQLLIGLLTGLLFRDHKFNGLRSVLAIAVITLVGTVTSSIITTFVFSGVTSSGSAYVVALLRSAGQDLLQAVFLTQFVTDLIDKVIAFILTFLIIRVLPKTYISELES